MDNQQFNVLIKQLTEINESLYTIARALDGTDTMRGSNVADSLERIGKYVEKAATNILVR